MKQGRISLEHRHLWYGGRKQWIIIILSAIVTTSKHYTPFSLGHTEALAAMPKAHCYQLFIFMYIKHFIHNNFW